jgi:hypothetical protein
LKIRKYARPLRALAVLVALCLTSAAQGATITVHPEDNNGRIFVDIAGEITLTDIKTFSDKIEHLPSEKVYVSLSSEGGDAVAVVIGNYIRLSGMKTLVPENKKCVSVCAIIWLGARDRYVGGENTAIGFHGVYNKNTGQPGSMNVRIAVYLGYLDLSYDAVDWILGAPPLAIRWLTPETSKQYGIYYSDLRPKRSVPFVDDQVANTTPAPTPPPQVSTPPQNASGTITIAAAVAANYAGAKTAVPRRGCIRRLSHHPQWPRPNVSRNCEDAPGRNWLGRALCPARRWLETVLRSGMAGSKRLGIKVLYGRIGGNDAVQLSRNTKSYPTKRAR